ASSPRPGPEPLELPAGVLPAHGTLVLGDLHGTREIPGFVARMAATVASREPVVLALEIPPDESPAIQAFLASDGSAASRSKLIAGPWWQDVYQDGRRTVAMADLLETVRALRAAGRSIDVVTIDNPSRESEIREEDMAQRVIAARRAHPDAALIV